MGQSIFQSSPEFAGANKGDWVGTVVVGGGGGASSNEENSTPVGAGVGVAEEHRRWGRWFGRRLMRCSVWEAQYVPCQEGEQGHLQSTSDRAGLYVIDRLSISSGNTTP